MASAMRHRIIPETDRDEKAVDCMFRLCTGLNFCLPQSRFNHSEIFHVRARNSAC